MSQATIGFRPTIGVGIKYSMRKILRFIGRAAAAIVGAGSVLPVPQVVASEWIYLPASDGRANAVMAPLVHQGFVGFSCRSADDLTFLFKVSEMQEERRRETGPLAAVPQVKLVVDHQPAVSIRVLHSKAPRGGGIEYTAATLADRESTTRLSAIARASAVSADRFLASLELAGFPVSQAVVGAETAKPAFESLIAACKLP